MIPDLLTTYYLEMNHPSELLGKPKADGLSITEVEAKQWQFNKFLYALVGKQWLWTDKLPWSDDEWREYVESATLRTWVAYHRGAIAGYFELANNAGNIEIVYFGLTPHFFGKGFGGYLLTAAIENGWNWPGAERVWVHTCNLDHPAALPNYLSRGLKIYKTETIGAAIPAASG
jgi:GNAT superfamily N-acetyltransferase